MAIIKTVLGHTPRWGERCYLADNAVLAGDIIMGDDCSVWFNAVLRADVDCIRMGSRVNIQDGACLHQSHGAPVVLEDDVTVGHLAMVHGCTVRRGALIGMNATLLDGCEVGEGAIVAAGALVLQHTKIPPHEIWAGVPARRVKACATGQAEEFAQHYMEAKKWYREEDTTE